MEERRAKVLDKLKEKRSELALKWQESRGDWAALYPYSLSNLARTADEQTLAKIEAIIMDPQKLVAIIKSQEKGVVDGGGRAGNLQSHACASSTTSNSGTGGTF